MPTRDPPVGHRPRRSLNCWYFAQSGGEFRAPGWTGFRTSVRRYLVAPLALAGLWPDAVGERQHDLEEIFLELTTANGGVN